MSDDLTAMMQGAADAEEFGEVSSQALQNVSKLANDWFEKQRQLEDLQLKAAELKNQIQELEQNAIPELMGELGMKKFELADGSQITTKDEVYISIKAEQRNAAYEWLGENGHGSIVKHEIGCQFGKGEDSEAEKLKDVLTNAGYKFSDKQNVHPSTLKSWARQELENGRVPPEELFSLFEVTVAKIKPAG